MSVGQGDSDAEPLAEDVNDGVLVVEGVCVEVGVGVDVSDGGGGGGGSGADEPPPIYFLRTFHIGPFVYIIQMGHSL